jgi:hypothetical protein
MSNAGLALVPTNPGRHTGGRHAVSSASQSSFVSHHWRV